MSPAAKKKAPAHAPTPATTLDLDGPKAWAAWLKKHHAASAGVWLRFHKKATGRQVLSYAQALDEALCWGWIDGQAKPFDAESWLQRYTPRRPRSGWSKRNRDHVARLEKEGRMRAPGRAQVAAAQADGRWDAAYDSPSQAQAPADLRKALKRHPQALAFFKTLNRANVYAIAYRLQTAKKPETRQRRFDAILAMLKEGRKFH